MTDEDIAEYLRENGYPKHVVRGGVQGLIERWAKFVEEVEDGYRLGLEDYRNDLDARGVIGMAGLDDRVEDADKRFAALLKAQEVRVFESSAGNPFWDFGYPRNASEELLRDLRAEGLIE